MLPGAGPLVRRVWRLQKCLCPRRHSIKTGSLRRQVINLTPPRRVKTWGHAPWGFRKLTLWNECQTVYWTASARSRGWLSLPVIISERLIWKLGRLFCQYHLTDGLRNFARLGKFKQVVSEAVLQAKKAKPSSSSRRVSGWTRYLAFQKGSLPLWPRQKRLKLPYFKSP